MLTIGMIMIIITLANPPMAEQDYYQMSGSDCVLSVVPMFHAFAWVLLTLTITPAPVLALVLTPAPLPPLLLPLLVPLPLHIYASGSHCC